MYPVSGDGGLLRLVQRLIGANSGQSNVLPRGLLIVLLAIASWMVLLAVLAALFIFGSSF